MSAVTVYVIVLPGAMETRSPMSPSPPTVLPDTSPLPGWYS